MEKARYIPKHGAPRLTVKALRHDVFTKETVNPRHVCDLQGMTLAARNWSVAAEGTLQGLQALRQEIEEGRRPLPATAQAFEDAVSRLKTESRTLAKLKPVKITFEVTPAATLERRQAMREREFQEALESEIRKLRTSPQATALAPLRDAALALLNAQDRWHW